MPVLPQFPLGTVLLPTMVLPLHVFEPRYRALTRDVLAADGTFGVPLIERGSEVGGGDVRSDVGTVARIVEARELPDGRWAVVAIGVHRYRVVRWLDDDPYPRAEVEDWPDDDAPIEAGTYRTAVAAVRRSLALAAEVGVPAAASTVELSDDPGIGSFQLAAIVPVGPLDKQAMLRAASAAERIDRARRAAEESIEVLRVRLDSGDSDDHS